MSVSLFFGLPGAGKTTIMASIAYKTLKAKRPKYRHVLSNVDFGKIPPFDKVTVIDADDLGKYEGFEDSLILIDEASLEWDSRNFKNFKREKLVFFLLHRHWNCDICLFTQQWDAIDRKIRVITDRVYYVFKGTFTGLLFSKYYRIPYGIIIPDPKQKNSGEKLGEIIQGYCKPNFIQRVFCHRVFRPKFYKYFNSWERPVLQPCPYEIKEIGKQKRKRKSREEKRAERRATRARLLNEVKQTRERTALKNIK